MKADNQEDTQLSLDLSNPAMIIVKLKRKESLRQSCGKHHIVNGSTPERELAYAQCACVFFAGKMADRIQGREHLISATEQFQKNATNFLTFVAH